MTEQANQPERCRACGHDHDPSTLDCVEIDPTTFAYCGCTEFEMLAALDFERKDREIDALRATIEQQAREIENKTAQLKKPVAALITDAALGANLRKVVDACEDGIDLFHGHHRDDPEQRLLYMVTIDGETIDADTLDAAIAAAAAAALAEEPGE